MNDKRLIAETSKYLIRYLIQIPSYYKKSSKPHIFLFSTRRGGSTLLRDIIYSQKGFNFIDQPFDLTQYNWNVRRLPQVKLGQFITLTPAEQEQVKAYVHGILDRKYVFRSQWQFWKGGYHWSWERYVVKILSAKSLIHWFEDTFPTEIQIVYMTRHPVPTSLSIIKRNWELTTNAYLENEWFVDTQLSNVMLSLIQQIIRSGTELEKHTLNWCLENLIPLRSWRISGWLTVSYERLLTDPYYSIQRLAQVLNLSEPEKMLSTLAIPTRTALSDSKQKIISNGAQARLNTWQKQVDSRTIVKLNNLLEAFEIDLYNADSVIPISDFDA